MLTEQYRTLIHMLIEKTDNHGFTWGKGESRYSYEAANKENKFRVGKYFAGNDNSSCLNLGAFDKTGVLILEIVLCKEFEDQREDYDLLSSLYTKVKQSIADNAIQEELPVITSILQSLQQA